MGYDKDYEVLPITFERGLVESVEDMMLPPGACSVMHNYIADPAGNARVRYGWMKGSTTGLPATRKGIGAGIYNIPTKPRVRQKFLQASSVAPSNTTQHTINMTLNKPMVAGNAAILAFVATTGTMTNWTITDGWIPMSSTQDSVEVSNWYFNPSVDATTTFTINVTLSVSGQFTYRYIFFELENLATDLTTPTNMMGEIHPFFISFDTTWNNVVPSVAVLSNATATISTHSPGPGGSGGYSNPDTGDPIGYDFIRVVRDGADPFSLQTPAGTSGIPVSASTQYTASSWLKRTSGTLTYSIDIRWYTSAGSLISTSGGTEQSPTSTFARYSTTATSPSNAAYAAIRWESAGTGTLGNDLYIDAVQFEQAASASTWHHPLITQMDLYPAAAGTTNYSWTSQATTAHVLNSISALPEPVALEIAVVGTGSNSQTYSNAESPWVIDQITDIGTLMRQGIYYAQDTNVANTTLTLTANGAAPVKYWLFRFPGANYETTVNNLYVAHNNTTTMDIYQIDEDTLGTGGTWSLLESLPYPFANSPVAFTTGNQKLFYTHIGMANPRSYGAQGVVPPGLADLTGAPSGRCIAWHKSRLFIGGTLGNPERLAYSEVDDDTNWTTGTSGYIDVGLGDGEAIEDIAPVEDGLLIGKKTSLWFLVGAGPSSFRLYKLPSMGGIAPGRTITPTAYGAFCLGDETIQVYSGGAVNQISGNVVDSWNFRDNGGLWATGAVVNDTFYACDGATGALSLDLLEGTWATEGTSNHSTEGIRGMYNKGNTLFYYTNSATSASILNYRQEPHGVRQKDFDTLTETFTLTTPEIWPTGPEEKFTPRYLFLKLYQRFGDANDTALTITPYFEGRAQTNLTVTPEATAGTRWYRFSIGEEKGVSSLQFRFQQAAASGTTAVFDICEVSVGVNVEKVR